MYLQLPDHSKVKLYKEPYVLGTIVFPEECMGKMLTLCEVSIDEQAVTQACTKLVLYPARRRRLNTRKVTCMHTRSKDFANEESVYTLYVLTAHVPF